MVISALTKVRDILASLYTDERDVRRIVADAGLDLRRIDFTGQALSNWQTVLAEAEKTDKVESLLRVVLAEYNDHPELGPAVEQYRTGIAEPGDSPFKGLQYFDTSDAHLFFGREALTAELVDHLHQQRFLAIVGASGSGKSSLVRAGLVPTLQCKKMLTGDVVLPAGSEHWPIHLIRPTERPLKELATSLTAGESDKMTLALMDDLKEDARVLDMRASKLLSKRATTGNRLVVVVDQFEETFTLCRDKVERQAFVDNLLTAATVDGPVIVVITLRADFYAHCAEFENLRAALESYQRFIGPMKREELRRAIESPAHQNGWAFEPGLVELLMDDVGDEPGGLPLLSHALLETWRRRRGRQLTFTGYTESGRVQGAIAQTAQTIYQKLKPDQQNIARNIFLRLTELGEGSEDTRRRVIRQDLIPHVETGANVESVLKTLADPVCL